MPESRPSALPPPPTVRGSLAQLVRGMLMGSADLVPGVSGGTVALVLGIYEQFIASLHSGVEVLVHLAKGDVKGAGAALRRVPFVWLGALGIGILTVVFLGASTLSVAIERYPVQLAGLFCGLIAAAVVICWRQLMTPGPRHWQVLVLSSIVTFVLLGLSPASETSTEVTTPLWGFFLGGAVAITAMVLPGISGSFILVLLGLYSQVLAAVADRDLVVIAVFGPGSEANRGRRRNGKHGVGRLAESAGGFPDPPRNANRAGHRGGGGLEAPDSHPELRSAAADS